MTTWITRLDIPADATGPRVAVKDAIDVEGIPTTAGCAALADDGEPATRDAACLAGARAAGARLVGKANLHELCFGTSGDNPWFGTPVNPLDPTLVPGGSSSGSAVAVAAGEADVGIGTDTGGSVRVPAACCGIVGLKTTYGRVPLDGVWPLSPSLDTVGPLGRDVAAVVTGMQLLEPGFTPAAAAAKVVGRVRVVDVPGLPDIDAAIDDALRIAEFELVDVHIDLDDAYHRAFTALLCAEAWASDRALVERAPDRIGAQVLDRLHRSSAFSAADLESALAFQHTWRDRLRNCFTRFDILALPTLPTLPPALGADGVDNAHLSPFNLSGNPAIALPVPLHARGSRVPASLQLVGPHGGEEVLCTTAAHVERALLGA